MVKRLISLLSIFFYSTFLFCGGEPLQDGKGEAMVINSGEAQYNGKEIILSGDVQVQHSLGDISAHRLSIMSQLGKETQAKLGLLKIDDDVNIKFKQSGELVCQHAEVDYEKMQGVFFGNAASPDVVYMNRGEDNEKNGQKRLPFELRCVKMRLQLTRGKSSVSQSGKILVKQIEADEKVRVVFFQDYLMLADHAVYQRISDEEAPIAGLLTMTVRGVLPACSLTNVNGDVITARMIQLNTDERKVWITDAAGTLSMQQGGSLGDELEFLAQELMWDHIGQSMLLRGNVSVRQGHGLTLTTPYEVAISHSDRIKGKRSLKSLYSPRDTHLNCLEKDQEASRRIVCPGPFNIDHEKQIMTLHRRVEESADEGIEEGQVYIEDAGGEAYADHLYIDYGWVEGQLRPEKMVLEGNVRLMNRFNGKPEEVASVLHFALADRIEYFPQQMEMVLTAGKEGRVLFFDKVNNIRMSAPSLKIRQDAETKKEIIQGVGDVRFTFIEKEMDQLKKKFPFQKETKNEKTSR